MTSSSRAPAAHHSSSLSVAGAGTMTIRRNRVGRPRFSQLAGSSWAVMVPAEADQSVDLAAGRGVSARATASRCACVHTSLSVGSVRTVGSAGSPR